MEIDNGVSSVNPNITSVGISVSTDVKVNLDSISDKLAKLNILRVLLGLTRELYLLTSRRVKSKIPCRDVLDVSRPSLCFWSRSRVSRVLIYHRCTVVGNPGGGPWFFWQIPFREVLGVGRKSGGESCFISFLCGNFSKIFIGGT
jgi:hypothetical protein